MGKKIVTGAVPAYVRLARRTDLTAIDGATFELAHGELALSATRRATIRAGVHAVDVAPGAVVHVLRDGNVLRVRSLCDTVGKAVHVFVAGKAVCVNVGEELVVGTDDQTVDAAIKADRIGRREVNKYILDDRFHIVKSELPIISLIQKSELLTDMYSKGSQADRSIMERVMKMAAALFHVTGRRGAYSSYAPNTANLIHLKASKTSQSTAN